MRDEFADPCDTRHGARVADLADILARRLGWDARRRARLRFGGILHDIGKLTVSPALLRKPGRLDEGELAEIRRHPAAGARIVEPIISLRAVVPCILYHHERWDGAGYPSGRSGTRIPFEARLLAVADAFDAMVSDRPYRLALSTARALDELAAGAGTQFDPALAEAFLSAWHAGTFGPESAATALPRLRASTAFA